MIAFAVFVVLLVAGINVVVAVGPSFDAPTKRTTVTEASLGVGTGKRTTEVERGRVRQHPPFSAKHAKKATTTIERPIGKPSQKQTVTVEHGSRSFVERALGKSGLIGLQLAIVVLAAFLGAALLHRALIGDFSVKLGNIIELDAAQEAASDNDAALAAEINKLAATVGQRIKIQEEASALINKTIEDQKGVGLSVVALDQKLVMLEKQIATLKRATTSTSRSKGSKK